MRDVQDIIRDIQTFQFGGSEAEQLTNLADELDEHSEAKAAIRPILELFERYPDEDFGTPGPLAHVIERFYRNGYEHELALSLKRRPTILTVWLANRIANAKDSKSAEFTELLNEIAERVNVDEHVRKEARHFADLHNQAPR